MALLQQPPNYSAQYEKFNPLNDLITSRASNIIGQESQLTQEKQRADIDRFTEKSNLTSMVTAAQKYAALPKLATPEETQARDNQYLQTRIDEINARGGDPRDTQEFMTLTPEQRNESVQNIMKIGLDRGIITPPGKAAARPTITKNILRDGKNVEIMFDAQTGEEINQLGQKGTTGTLKTFNADVVDPDGVTRKHVFNSLTGEDMGVVGITPEKPPLVEINEGKAEMIMLKSDRKLYNDRALQVYKTAGATINKARNNIRQMTVMKTAISKIPKKSWLRFGAQAIGSEPVMAVAKVVNSGLRLVGMTPLFEAEVSAAQVIASQNTLYAVNVRVEGSGQTSNYEMQLYKQTISSLDDSPDGMRMKTELSTLESERQKKIAIKIQQLTDDRMPWGKQTAEVEKMLAADPYDEKVKKILGTNPPLREGVNNPIDDAQIYNPSDVAAGEIEIYDDKTGTFIIRGAQ